MRMKKFLAFISALCMVCAVVPVQTSAEEITEKKTYHYETLTYEKYEDYIEITGGTPSIGMLIIPAEIDGLPVKKIAAKAFNERLDLQSVSIPDGVTEIGYWAFNCCGNLSSIDIPESVTVIEGGADAFLMTRWLRELQAQNSLVTVNQFLLDGAQAQGDVIIPQNIKIIADGAFMCNRNITSVVIPSSVNQIGMLAFDGCEALTSVTIKNPKCEINPECYTLGGTSYGNSESITIYGYKNSTAQAYAEEYGYKFEVIGSEPQTETLKQGDASGDGEVDILDVITINKAILGKENLSENGLKAIDFNDNGKPDADEALTLLKYIVGLITDFNA